MLFYFVSIDYFFFFKQKTAYEMRISDWSSDVCSSDLKIWNAFRLVKSWELNDEKASAADLKVAKWFESKFNSVLIEIEGHFDNYRLSDALKIGRASCRERVCQYV